MSVCPHCEGTGRDPKHPEILPELEGVRLTPAEGIVAAALVKAKGAPVRESALRVLLQNYTSVEHGSNVVKVHIWKMRAKLKGKPIEFVNHRGVGYSMRPARGVRV